ncbi:hypothetical protein SALBM217S_04431 [Streptomyces griseoloalbus]
MGDYLRYAMYDKYFKKMGNCTRHVPALAGTGKDASHYLLSWYYAWGGATDTSAGWSWRIGSSHAHGGYQNPLAAYALATLRPAEAEVGLLARRTGRSPTTGSWSSTAGSSPTRAPSRAARPTAGRAATPPRRPAHRPSTACTTTRSRCTTTRRRTSGSASRRGLMERVAEVYQQTGNAQAKAVLRQVGRLGAVPDHGEPGRFVPHPVHAAAGPARPTPGTRRRRAPTAGCTSRSSTTPTTSVWHGYAKVLTYYAARSGDTEAADTAKALLDGMWANNQDDLGIAVPETRTDYQRFDDPVHVPSGWTGTMPNGYWIDSSSTFLSIRSFYQDDPAWSKIESYLEGGSAPVFTYHRFWAQADIATAMGAYAELLDSPRPRSVYRPRHRTPGPTGPGGSLAHGGPPGPRTHSVSLPHEEGHPHRAKNPRAHGRAHPGGRSARRRSARAGRRRPGPPPPPPCRSPPPTPTPGATRASTAAVSCPASSSTSVSPYLAYARTDIGGAYRWQESTRSWIPLLDSVGWDDWGHTGVVSIALDSADPDRVYAAVGTYTNDWDPGNGAVMRSGDRGASWRKTVLPFKLGGNMPGRGMGERLAVDPHETDGAVPGARPAATASGGRTARRRHLVRGDVLPQPRQLRGGSGRRERVRLGQPGRRLGDVRRVDGDCGFAHAGRVRRGRRQGERRVPLDRRGRHLGAAGRPAQRGTSPTRASSTRRTATSISRTATRAGPTTGARDGCTGTPRRPGPGPTSARSRRPTPTSGSADSPWTGRTRAR